MYRMRANWFLPLLSLFFCFAFTASSKAQSHSSTVPKKPSGKTQVQSLKSVGTLTGNWQRQESSSQRSARLKVIDDVTSEMNWLMRGKAKEKLREATAKNESISIQDNGNNVAITATGRPRLSISTDGKASKIKGQAESGTVRASRQNGVLILEMEGGNGSRTTRYTLSPDKSKLTLDVKMSSPNLPKPLQYQVTYIRATNTRKATNRNGNRSRRR